jgi:hypothetical protein
MAISESTCIIVLKPMFITNLEPRGKILLEKNRTAIDKTSSSSKERRYSERIFTLIFLLLVVRILSQAFTKFENRVESLTDGMQIHLLCSRELLSVDYKNKLVNMAVIVIKNACEMSSIF